MREQKGIIYREIQRPRQPLLWVIIVLEVAYMWYWFIQQIIFDE